MDTAAFVRILFLCDLANSFGPTLPGLVQSTQSVLASFGWPFFLLWLPAEKTLFLNDQLYSYPHSRTSLCRVLVSIIAYLSCLYQPFIGIVPGRLVRMQCSPTETPPHYQTIRIPVPFVCQHHDCMCIRHACARMTFRGRKHTRTQSGCLPSSGRKQGNLNYDGTSEMRC